MRANNSVVKIQSFVVNRKSRPVKLNPDLNEIFMFNTLVIPKEKFLYMHSLVLLENENLL